MKSIKFVLFTLTLVSLSLLAAACPNNAVNTTANNAAAVNSGNKSNTIVVNSASPKAANTATDTTKTNKTSNTPSPAELADASTFTGELQVGDSESLILYVGAETGDYAAYCFSNSSEAGKAILAACKDKGQCEVKGTSEGGSCKVPGLEADLSDSGRIIKVLSAKPLGGKK